MLIGLAQSKINELITGRKIGITYDVNPDLDGLARGGTFADTLEIVEITSNRQGQLSQIAIEKGSKFTDNWRPAPRTLNIQISISNLDNITNNALIATAANLITGSNNCIEAVELLNRLYDEAIICDITTRFNDYRNFKLVNDPSKEDWQTQEHIVFNSVWQEVPFFEESERITRQRLYGSITSLGSKIKSLL